MMEIRCECGKFRAELKSFPRNTPGRLKCYCDDCQTYLHYLKRGDLLDSNGGTEIIPAYPADVEIIDGKEFLKCTQLLSKGMFRFSTSCCNTPIANTRPGMPWIGFHRRVFTAGDANKLDQMFGAIRSSIYGRFAKGTPPKGTPDKFDLRAFLSVAPFMLRGRLLKKFKPSPFFREDGLTPIVAPHALSSEELKSARASAGF